MYMTKEGIALIKKWEGFEPVAYLCPAGVWTIGYGHTSAAGEPRVTRGMRVSTAQAHDILLNDLKVFERAVSRALTRPATPAQFSAMVSLCYNIGVGAFASSSVLRRFNEGDTDGAARAFHMWNKVTFKGKKAVLPGLINRRKDEADLFMSKIAESGNLPVARTVPAPAPAPSLWQRIKNYFRNYI